MKNARLVLMMALIYGNAWAAEDPPSPGSFRLRSEATAGQAGAAGCPKPYSAPCTEREGVFAFTEKPAVKVVGKDKYEITFAVKGNCDVAVAIVDSDSKVVRHLGAGVLGANAPAPFQKNSLKQTIPWNGKDDLDVYYREPAKLRAKVMLGLKPEFDKRLGGTSPYNLPGRIWGLAADQDGVYVISYGVRFYIRSFDHDGKYVRSLLPPPRGLPEAKLGGRAYVEYESGKRSILAPSAYQTTALEGDYMPFRGRMHMCMQPAVSNGRIVYCNSGSQQDNPTSLLHWIGTDGSTDPAGMEGRVFAPGRMHGGRNNSMSLAASPDGKWIYMTDGLGGGGGVGSSCVWRGPMEGKETADVFAGKFTGKGRQAKYSPGSGPGEFNDPKGLDCDSQGRLYVCDGMNNRLQILSPDGKFLKDIPIERPAVVQVHKKTGAIYIHHTARVQGKSVDRVSRLASLENPKVTAFLDHPATCMAVDSWAAEPTVWLGGGAKTGHGTDVNELFSISVWRDKGDRFVKAVDFDDEARKEAGGNYFGRWYGERSKVEKIAADPVREKIYYCSTMNGPATYVFDLQTGKLLHLYSIAGADDISFDKRGYMHKHLNPGFYMPGVAREDPDQPVPARGRRVGHLPNVEVKGFKEVPYDYGIEKMGPYNVPYLGILPVRDQPGAKFFQDGIGVNMMGYVAENCNIYYAPKMEAETDAFIRAGNPKAKGDSHEISDDDENNATAFIRLIQEMEKRGEEVYWIRRQPGVPSMGATIWTFNANGEIKDKCAVTAGGLINGVQMDEDGKLYFVNNRTKRSGDRSFLAGRGGTFGVPDDRKNRDPFTGTLLKTRENNVLFQQEGASVPMDSLPPRPSELLTENDRCWVEGVEWTYGGASPIVAGGCSCPTMRIHTDWYKRTFVPESYRHSVGILDANGNLIMHLGRYGNFDDAPTVAGKAGEDIAMSFVNVIAGTDNYICFPDHGERLVVMKLNYHAEESTAISN